MASEQPPHAAGAGGPAAAKLRVLAAVLAVILAQLSARAEATVASDWARLAEDKASERLRSWAVGRPSAENEGQMRLAEGAPRSNKTEAEEERLIVETLARVKGFLWGASTASYQVEGAALEGGRQKSIWDVFSHQKGKIAGADNGDVADDFYHTYEGDLQRVKDLGMNSFRFSVSWTRVWVQPRPWAKRQANPEGVRFYRRIIQRLQSMDIIPVLTMFHWDLPLGMDWRKESTVDAYLEYADFLFRTFPEVRHWITFNEPSTFCLLGYAYGIHAPGVKSNFSAFHCGHNVLRAHARAVDLYRRKYKATNRGQIGITLNYDFAYPLDPEDPEHLEAAQLHHDFNLGWWADPIYLTGDYPESMKERLGEHLLNFTDEEKTLLKGSYEGFYGLNTYSANYVIPVEGYYAGFSTKVRRNGTLIGPQGASPWLHVVPAEMQSHLEYVTNRYNPTSIIITESGCDAPHENDLPLKEALEDTFRVDYYRSYIGKVVAAISQSKAPVRGYFAWSLLDNFEWSDGYKYRFGLYRVDYGSQERIPKASAKWFARLLLRWKKERDALTWTVLPKYDLPNTGDVAVMDAGDIEAVKAKVEEQGYGGFSVFEGKAYLKLAGAAESQSDLTFMGEDSNAVFYLYAPGQALGAALPPGVPKEADGKAKASSSVEHELMESLLGKSIAGSPPLAAAIRLSSSVAPAFAAAATAVAVGFGVTCTFSRRPSWARSAGWGARAYSPTYATLGEPSDTYSI